MHKLKLKKKTPETDSLFDNVDPLIPDIEFIKKELKYLRNAIDKQNNSISTIASMLTELLKGELVSGKHESKIILPIETETELDELENEVKENPEKYNDIFRGLIFARGGLEKNFKHIISSEVAINYNWDGTSGKKAFKNLKHLNVALYNAIQPEISSPEIFKRAIRQGLKRIKNLHFKRKSLQKKQDLKVTIDGILTF